MNPRMIMHVAFDVIREALASKYLIVLFGLIFIGLVVLALALDLEVVNGAVAATKVFGSSLMTPGKITMADELLGPLMQSLALVVFYGGIVFLVVAVADIAPRMLSPGRVEHLLALPLRRTELVVGIYVGVVLIALLAGVFAIGGASLVLFIKLEIVTPAPLMGAFTAMVGFMTVYGVMLAVASVARSAALSAGAAFIVYFAGIATSNREFVLSLFRNQVVREVLAVVMGPLPRFRPLADIGGEAAVHANIAWAQAGSVVGGCIAFGLFFVVLACIVVNVKDY